MQGELQSAGAIESIASVSEAASDCRRGREVKKRGQQIVLIASTLIGSWLGMQAVHEFGHVLGAWLTGGRVSRVVLSPISISRTDLSSNPKPLFVVWSGPVVGALLPLAVWAAAIAVQTPGAFVLRFFAGFCLIANGAYIAVGSFDGIGDCGVMRAYGSPVCLHWLFGVTTAPSGLWLWHGQAIHFGVGTAAKEIDAGVSYATLAVAAVLIAVGFLLGPP